MRKVFVGLAVLAAIHSSQGFAAERDAIERAKLAFSEQLQSACLASGEYEWIAEDAVYQYPLNDINVKLRIEGRDAVARHLRAVSEVAPGMGVENIHYYPTLDRNIVFVRYDRVSHGSSGERRPVAAIIEMRGEEIVNFTQLNGTRESLLAVQAVAGDTR